VFYTTDLRHFEGIELDSEAPHRPYDWLTTYVVSHELQRLTEELALTQPLSHAAGAPARGPALFF